VPYWVSSEIFEQTMALAERHADRTRVDITFDDGNLSDVEIALPVLGRYRRHATFFVLSGRIGSPGCLGKDELRAITEAGHLIGTHGAAHIDWRAADEAALEHELGKSTREAIEEAAAQPVTMAAIPFGRYNAAVLRALSRHGYRQAYSSDGGSWCDGQWPIPRTSPRSDMTLEDIENIVLGREPAKARLRRAASRSLKRII
jgi:peptidoglycan/xylan/chitin deacetylase (PgdA/CDA1 family)